jgi:hypothetical protein
MRPEIELAGTLGLDPHHFGTHSLRRTKSTLINRRTDNLRAGQILVGHRKIESNQVSPATRSSPLVYLCRIRRGFIATSFACMNPEPDGSVVST